MEKDLKLVSCDVILKSDLSKSAKFQLINFVEGASEIQLKAFMLDGNIISESINDESKQILSERFEASKWPAYVNSETSKNILARIKSDVEK